LNMLNSSPLWLRLSVVARIGVCVVARVCLVCLVCVLCVYCACLCVFARMCVSCVCLVCVSVSLLVFPVRVRATILCRGP
jgi:hypothetical protein